MHREACRCSLLALLVLAFALSAAALAVAFALGRAALDAALAAVALDIIDKPWLPLLALLPPNFLLAIVNPLPALAFPMRGIAPNLVAVAARRKKVSMAKAISAQAALFWTFRHPDPHVHHNCSTGIKGALMSCLLNKRRGCN